MTAGSRLNLLMCAAARLNADYEARRAAYRRLHPIVDQKSETRAA